MIEEGVDDFPTGWEMRFTSSGVPYYVDHMHRTTTFEDPRVAHREKRRQKAAEHERSLPKYKRDLRRKLLRLRDLFAHRLQACRGRSAEPLSQDPGKQPKVDIAVSRETVFEDSYMVISKLKPEQFVGNLNIEFFGEDALDYGGVAREWFFLLSKEMLNPYYGLFEPCGSDQYLLQINPLSNSNPDHLSYFHFVGRVLGLAVKHSYYVEGGFVMPLFKLLLGKEVSLKDMEQVDPEYYSSLVWMLENDITDIIENTFVDERFIFGEMVEEELKPGGSSVAVTEENKHEYVRLIVKHRLLHGIQKQVMALKGGFNEIVPPHFIADMFDEREMELIICGLGAIDVADWAKHTEYRHFSATDDLAVWFWAAVTEMGPEVKARLLQFVTGTSRVPVTGFNDLQGSLGPKKFTLEFVASADADSLPKAHTCFNRLDLPPYTSMDQLAEKLSVAVENTIGFGIE